MVCIEMQIFSFVLILFIAVDVNGQSNNFNGFSSNSFETNSRFGQFQNLIDNQKPPLIKFDFARLNEEQPTPLSCYRIRANIKNAHPTDNTKYYICRDEFRYEVFTCPNGGIFDNKEKACIDLCEQTKPCLNKGQCIILSNLTLQCVCRRDWTGELCEIPLSTCASNPCGSDGECRMLKANDYSQDYVCICDNQQSYGRDCQQTVPNPCLHRIQQFHPFQFSRQAYINCDKDVIFFQPCNANLYWNQQGLRCDRSLPNSLTTPLDQFRDRNGQNFQVQSNVVRPTQWQSDNVVQQPANSQFRQEQLWQQNQMIQGNEQQQNFPTVSQGLGTRQWSNQISNIQPQPSQRFNTRSQPAQETQFIQNQPLSQGQNQQSSTNTFAETTMMEPKLFHLQGFFISKSEEEESQRLNNGNNQIQASGDFKTQFIGQPQAQSGQVITPLETTTVANKGTLMRTLFGWQPHQQEPTNQIDEQKTLNAIRTFQLGAWKA